MYRSHKHFLKGTETALATHKRSITVILQCRHDDYDDELLIFQRIYRPFGPHDCLKKTSGGKGNDATEFLQYPITDLRLFLGLCNEYHPFVPNFDRLSSLNQRLKNGRPYSLILGNEERKAVDIIEDKLSKPSVLVFLCLKGTLRIDRHLRHPCGMGTATSVRVRGPKALRSLISLFCDPETSYDTTHKDFWQWNGQRCYYCILT